MVPDKPTPRKRGFADLSRHKAECTCNACAFQRKKEALALRGGGEELVPGSFKRNKTEQIMYADAEPLHVKNGTSPRHRVAQYLALRALKPGINYQEAGKEMGLSANTLNSIISRATREGWLIFDDPLKRVEHELIPKVISNLSELLDKKDRTTTLETAKGTIFKTYQESKGTLEVPQTLLAIKIEAGDREVKVMTGHIVGTPRSLKEKEE